MNEVDEILGLMLPDQNNIYLLPNVSIAEIFTFDHQQLVTAESQDRAGILGQVEWRQSLITLVHLNEFIDDKFKISDTYQHTKARVAVINPISKPEHPFYAILTTSTPRLTRLVSNDLKLGTKPPIDSVAYQVQYKQENFMIPDLEYLESAVRSVN